MFAHPDSRAHKILISHAQCELILTALLQCQAQGYFGADADDREEIDILARMFADLPAENDADTMLHGFCL